MKMTPDKLTINNIDFKWGTTFEEAQKLLPFEDIRNGYSAWQDFEFECSEIAGLGTTTCSIRGPKPNRPVMQVSFKLKPLKKGLFESYHTPYLTRLKKIFGEPHDVSTSDIPGGLKYNEMYASGSVIYNCKWWFGEILISLSVYGGIRTCHIGESAAGLYFDWMNEHSAAAPYIANFLNVESSLSMDVSQEITVVTIYKQQPYHRSHYELKDPFQSLKDQELRACQMTLYTNELYRAPKSLHEITDENMVGVFHSKIRDTYCVYDKWDFTPITVDSKLDFVNILPARGNGGKELRINSLILKDDQASNVLDELKSKLEELTGVEFTYIETYDD